MNLPEALLQEIGNYFLNSGEKIAVAESVTSGYLQNAFSQMEKASEFFNGGITAYTPEIKTKLLGVDPEEAEREDCVSRNITETLAKNVAKLLDSDWSIAVTGYATPVPESGHELFAYYSICHSGKIILSKKAELPSGTKPVQAQERYVEMILGDLRAFIHSI